MLADFRFAFRSLLKAPGFTAVVLLTLALGIGVNTAIFSVVHGVLLRPLDYPRGDRLVVIKETKLPQFPEFSVSPPDFLDWQKLAASFENITAIRGQSFNLSGGGEPQRLLGLRVSANYFSTYRVTPLLGRDFRAEEDAPGHDRVVVISYGFWQRQFAGAKNVLGQTLPLNGERYTVIGVMPATFQRSGRVEVWAPMAFSDEERSDQYRGAHFLNVVGRLKDGVSLEQAQSEMAALARQFAEKYPDSNTGWGTKLVPLLDYNVRDVRNVLYVLLAAVGCVLLIACANVANLLLTRATARLREISIRSALGASRPRIIRQLLTESVLLAVVGGALGAVFATWGVDALLALAPDALPRAKEISLDGRVLAFTAGLSVLTGLLFGIAPAWQASRTNLNAALKEGSRGSSDGSSRGRLRHTLVALEVAISLMLLVGAGLLVRSFARLAAVDPGFNPQHATAVSIALPDGKYGKPEQQRAFADALLEKMRALPGVKTAGITQALPLVDDWVLSFDIKGRPPAPRGQSPNTNYYAVTPDYFAAMGIRLVRGRLFTSADTAQSASVCLVNETFARKFFPHEDPLGQRINITNGPDRYREVIGVVADVKQYGIDRDSPAQAYDPFAQWSDNSLFAVVRTDDAPSPALLKLLRAQVTAVDPEQPVISVRPLTDIVAESITRQRFAMTLLTVFSLVALVIAAVGIYGVMAYSVSQRTNEIGIRMALGARPADVLQLILGQGLKVIAAGLLVGLLATLALARLVESMLYHTSARDPLTLAALTLLLTVIALVACLIPARRATRVDPMTALRAE